MTTTSRTFTALALLFAGCCVFTAGRHATAATQAVPFSERDGAEEANADIKANRRTTLYSAVHNGRAPGFITPGVAYCDPRYTGGPESPVVFAELPEAYWQEPDPFPPQYEAAMEFARRYNQTMFKAREADVKSACPKASLDDRL